MTAEQMAALIRAMEEAKAGYAPQHYPSGRIYYLGVMHGAEHMIDIVRRAVQQTGWEPGAPYQLFKCPFNKCNGRLGKAGDLCLACGSRLGEERIRK
jgi:hypothetical protein